MGRPYTAVEDSLIHQIYPVSGAKGCAKVLVGRGLDAIRKRANNIGAHKHSDAGLACHKRKPLEAYRLPPTPLSDLDRIALREWGRFTSARGPEQLMPNVGMNIPKIGYRGAL